MGKVIQLIRTYSPGSGTALGCGGRYGGPGGQATDPMSMVTGLFNGGKRRDLAGVVQEREKSRAEPAELGGNTSMDPTHSTGWSLDTPLSMEMKLTNMWAAIRGGGEAEERRPHHIIYVAPQTPLTPDSAVIRQSLFPLHLEINVTRILTVDQNKIASSSPSRAARPRCQTRKDKRDARLQDAYSSDNDSVRVSETPPS
ncbi:hypothetical protein FZEAL_6115 [Fusarium zealandicum]|uniref:Uncharacterized protein n=1 Tax=Fusarium zealandicum TaxID=1053134 RepID=A0A8H4XJX6_9HYPO|nr:hypothetical protein FZEAL_6115 [Fusarium zealandicum]